MLNWSDLTQDWASSYARAKARFPNLRDRDMAFVKKDRKRFEAYLAELADIQVAIDRLHDPSDTIISIKDMRKELEL